MNFIDKNNTWELCTLPRGIKAIGIKWMFKTKKRAQGNVMSNEGSDQNMSIGITTYFLNMKFSHLQIKSSSSSTSRKNISAQNWSVEELILNNSTC